MQPTFPRQSMPIIDIVIAVAIVLSVVVGFVRGFIREAISVAALLLAVWAALYLGPAVGEVSSSWLTSADLRAWFGRILVFAVVLAVGGLLGWLLSRLVRISVLSGTDRLLGSLFGAARGVILLAVFVLAGEFAGFANDTWWQESSLIPHVEVVAVWIAEMAPRGLDLLVPAEPADGLPVELPTRQ